MARRLSQDEVVAGRDALPSFPRVIDDILLTLDDPDANINRLVDHVGRDPALAARVFSQANAAARRTRHNATVRDLYTATSLIGLTRLRQTVITASLADFLRGALPAGLAPGFWEHSSAAGVSALQLAAHIRQAGDSALIAGLLHDIGQLWLARSETVAFCEARHDASTGALSIEAAEREHFGIDHAAIGAWLAESWGLPSPLCDAIRYHHAPDAGPNDILVPLLHVAEVLSNALDLSASGSARVTYLSGKACERLGLTWDESAEALFGRIDAVSHFVANYFKTQDVTHTRA